MDFQGIASLILALVGAAGLVTSYLLSKRGQKKDEKQQDAANRLAERMQAFDEMKELLDRHNSELTRMREENERLETKGNDRLERQKSRCRSVIEEMTSTVTALQGVVVSEVAREAAQTTADAAQRHLDRDHQEP